MFFDFENPIIGVSGVENLRWDGGIFEVAPRDYCALAFRIKGGAEILCGGEKYNIYENDVLYLPQGLGYQACYNENELIVFHFKTARSDTAPEVYSAGRHGEIKELFLKGYEIWESKSAGFIVDTVSVIYRILGLLCKRNAQANIPAHFSASIGYINQNYKNGSLTVGEICAATGIGGSAFRKLMQEIYRKTPVEYITELRLQSARSLIASGTPIETAALQSGFNDPKYFARVVKRVYGCTPRELKSYGR